MSIEEQMCAESDALSEVGDRLRRLSVDMPNAYQKSHGNESEINNDDDYLQLQEDLKQLAFKFYTLSSKRLLGL